MSAENRGAGGRPRAFDEEQALDGAIEVFWRLGYEGASMAELTSAMGINKPSLYSVFGSKEELFVRALERYGSGYREHLSALLAGSSTYDILESYLRATVQAVRTGSVPGCLSIQGGLACGPNNARIPGLLAEYRQGIEDALATALAESEDARIRGNGIDAAALARYAVTIGQGLAVDAAAGVGQERLETVVDVALGSLSSFLKSPGRTAPRAPTAK